LAEAKGASKEVVQKILKEKTKAYEQLGRLEDMKNYLGL
jgi:hypothetical protein